MRNLRAWRFPLLFGLVMTVIGFALHFMLNSWLGIDWGGP
jgi:hypothetical protein